jgi:hypothetical protein
MIPVGLWYSYSVFFFKLFEFVWVCTQTILLLKNVGGGEEKEDK